MSQIIIAQSFPKCKCFFRKNKIRLSDRKDGLVRRKGLEPLTYWFVASHSIQLSYRRIPLLTSHNIIAYGFGKSKYFFQKMRNLKNARILLHSADWSRSRCGKQGVQIGGSCFQCIICSIKRCFSRIDQREIAVLLCCPNELSAGVG